LVLAEKEAIPAGKHTEVVLSLHCSLNACSCNEAADSGISQVLVTVAEEGRPWEDDLADPQDNNDMSLLEDFLDNFSGRGLEAEAATKAAETVVLAYLHSERV
jgi:hypothetical protein